MSPTTVNKELSFARAVFNDFLAQLDQRGEPPISNPVRKLFLSEPEHRTRYLTDEEEERLQAAMHPADWPPVLVAIMTGIDRREMFSLTWTAVDFTTRTIHAERRKGRKKGPVPVRIPINEELLGVLRSLPSRLTFPWVFPNPTGTGPLDGDEYDRVTFQPALKRAGNHGLVLEGLAPHLRHPPAHARASGLEVHCRTARPHRHAHDRTLRPCVAVPPALAGARTLPRPCTNCHQRGRRGEGRKSGRRNPLQC